MHLFGASPILRPIQNGCHWKIPVLDCGASWGMGIDMPAVVDLRSTTFIHPSIHPPVHRYICSKEVAANQLNCAEKTRLWTSGQGFEEGDATTLAGAGFVPRGDEQTRAII
jgi:hypothetical protein